MKNILKYSYEIFIVLFLLAAFYIAMKTIIPPLAYYAIAGAGAAYFLIYKIARRMYMDTSHKALYVVSSVIIAALIGMSILRLSLGGWKEIRIATQTLFYINIAIMIYCFLKAVEGRDYLAHFAMIFFTAYLLTRL